MVKINWSSYKLLFSSFMLTQFCLQPAGEHTPKRVLSKGRCMSTWEVCADRGRPKRGHLHWSKSLPGLKLLNENRPLLLEEQTRTASYQGFHVNQSCSVKTPSLHSQIHADSTGTARLRCGSRWKEMHSHEVLLPATHLLHPLDGDCFSTTELLEQTVLMLLMHFKCEVRHFEQTWQRFELNCAFSHQAFCTDAEGQDCMSQSAVSVGL